MISAILCRKGGRVVSVAPAEVKEQLSQGRTIWVDVLNPSEDDLDFLHNTLLLHELALEDCRVLTHRPKAELYPKHLFVVVNDIAYSKEHVVFNKLGLFLGQSFLVTVHRHPIGAIGVLQKKLGGDAKFFRRGPDFLLFQLLSLIVEGYFPVFDDMDNTIDAVEGRVFTNPTASTLNKTLKLKRAVLELRKTIAPQREIVNSIIMGEFPYVRKENILYYRGVYDHLIRMHDLIDTYRDLLTGILDAYLSVVSNRMNEIMKVLTIIATIMMPLTVITGIYGMNFRFIPEIHSAWGQAYGYFFALGAMLAVGLIMVFFFKRRKWL
jgi:magnesium transporter